MSTVTPSRSVNPRPSASSSRTQAMKPASAAASLDPIRVLRRHMVLIAGSGVVGAVLGVVAFLVLASAYRLYSGQVMFEIQPGLQSAAQTGIIDTTNDEMVYRIAQTESFMITSREILDLAMNDAEILKTEWHKQYVGSDGTFHFQDAVDDLKEDVRAAAVRGSNLFSLTWSTHLASDVPVVLNAIADTYMSRRTARDSEVFAKNLTLFRNQSQTTERELLDLAQQMKSIIRAAGLTNLESIHNSSQGFRAQEITKQLAELSGALNISQSNLAMTQEQIQGTLEPTSMDYYEAERDPAIANLIESLQFQYGELRRLMETRDPNDPLVLKTQERVRGFEQQRDSKIAEIIKRNLEAKSRQYANDVERFGSTVQKLEIELEKMNALLKDLAAEQSQYESLKVRMEQLEAKRTADLQLINEVELMRLRADASRVRLAQKALTPREVSFPKPQIIVPLGILVLLVLTIGIVFLRELLDQRIKSASDLAVLPASGGNVLGSIPDVEDDPTKPGRPELVLKNRPMSVLGESFRQTLAAMMPMIDRGAHQTLLVMGGLPGTGTTTVISNLACAAAASGRKVLVVDANFRRPQLGLAMGLTNPEAPGLADVLARTSAASDVIVPAPQIEGVSVMTAGTPSLRISDRLNTPVLDGMVAELRGKFDIIFFDAPPAVVSGDGMILANKLDAAVVVVRAHQDHRGLVARMIHRLAETRCELLGVILNRPRGVAGGYLRKNYAAMATYTSSASS